MSNPLYKSIAKANVLFGGVQVFNIIISIIRSKVIAVLLGPVGVGIIGLFNSIIDLIKAATNMGLHTSAVRDVSNAYESNDINLLSQAKSILSRLIFISGCLGTILMFVFAPSLSVYSFGSQEYATHIRILSICILLSQYCVRNFILLQGLRKLKQLAKANVIGSAVGLIITLPLFYIFGVNAIVPVLLLCTLISFLFSQYYVNKINIPKIKIPLCETYSKGKDMIHMGFLISLTGFFDIFIVYFIKNLIQNWGSIAEVGLYTAGFGVIQQYVGLIFNSIGTDYYPRLISAVNNNNVDEVVNAQFELMILVLTPLILLFISVSHLLINLLYSSEFISITTMINWVAIGMLVRAYSWCPGFLYTAKNDTKTYFVLYIITSSIHIFLYIFLYKYGGLNGIGIAFLLVQIISCLIGLIVVRIRYGFSYNLFSNRLLLIALFTSASVLSLTFIDSYIKYIPQAIIILLTTGFCVKKLEEKIQLKQYILKLLKK